MIGLVIVSHSRGLAQSLVELIRQVSTTELAIAFAAGAGEDHSEFGTDAIEITEAIQSVYSDDGVLVLMDLGSAILSAEMALELLPEEMKSKIMFCPAPLVEGAIAAAVQAGLGSDLKTAFQEAVQALYPKREQLGIEEAHLPAPLPESVSEPEHEVTLTLRNMHGLHARPAAKFVQTAARFDADIRVYNLNNDKGPVSARSLNAIATLGAVNNHQIRITASGEQSSEALQALSELVNGNFGESVTEEMPVIRQPAAPLVQEAGAIQAVPVSEGVALGPVFHFQLPPPAIPDEPAENPQQEWERLQIAIGMVRKEIKTRHREMSITVGEEQAAIFEAHLLILDDPDLLKNAKAGIFEQGQNAAAAWHVGINKIVEQYHSLPDQYLQQRALDVTDVGNQVLYSLTGEGSETVIKLDHPVILVAEELTPTQTAQLDLEKINGIITLVGGPTSHSAILARSLGIPAITAVPASIARLVEGTPVALDGFSGTLWIDPADKKQAELQTRRNDWLQQRQSLLKTSHEPAITLDSHRIEVVANAGNLQDAQSAIQNGAEGIGLLRTEFLFLTRQEPPTEDEQMDALRQIGMAMQGHPVIVRTLDVGGDKALPYIQLPEEANPFLGVRAIRLSMQRPDLFRTQLRAILRAGKDCTLRIMFPMVAEIGEVRKARQVLQQVHEELTSEKIEHAWPIETGIMVEVPAAAVMAKHLASEVDFFSIGTNDLTQYTMAAERGNPNLSDFSDALHPAVLNLINQVVTAAHENGKWVGICGELAGDPLAAPVLIGLGIDELSLNPAGIPRIKSIVRSIRREDARALAIQTLKSSDAASVRKLAQIFAEKITLDC